jgi:hypothetical protein
MRFAPVLSTLLAVIVCAVPCERLNAQEFLPAEVDSARVDSWLNAPVPADHAGLLGKIAMQQRYLHLTIDDEEIRPIDTSLQGFDTYVNLPVMTLNTPAPLDFDVFFGYTNAGLKGSTNSGPPFNADIYLNGKSEVFSVGTTIYPTLCEKWRPFVQVGAEFGRADVDMAVSTGPIDGFATNFVDHDTDLLLNAGFELDLLDYLGYRMTFHAETSDRFRDSVITNDLILWPHERIFVRGGLITSLDNGGPGFSIGGGLAF